MPAPLATIVLGLAPTVVDAVLDAIIGHPDSTEADRRAATDEKQRRAHAALADAETLAGGEPDDQTPGRP